MRVLSVRMVAPAPNDFVDYWVFVPLTPEEVSQYGARKQEFAEFRREKGTDALSMGYSNRGTEKVVSWDHLPERFTDGREEFDDDVFYTEPMVHHMTPLEWAAMKSCRMDYGPSMVVQVDSFHYEGQPHHSPVPLESHWVQWYTIIVEE